MSRTWMLAAGAVGVGVGLWWHFRKSSSPSTSASTPALDEGSAGLLPVTYMPSDIERVEQIEPVIARAGVGWNMGALIRHGQAADYRIFQIPDASLAHKPSAASWSAAIAKSLGVDPSRIQVSG